MVVCYGFAAELYLKTLMVIELGKSIGTHRLEVLFGRLSDVVQNELRSKWDRTVILDGGVLDVSLKAFSAAFVDWRYIYEEDGRQIPAGDLIGFAQALYLLIRELQPAWEVSDHLHERVTARPPEHIMAVINAGGGKINSFEFKPG